MASEARVFAEGAERAIVRQVIVANANPLSKGQLLIFGAASRTGIAHTTNPTVRPLGYTVEEKEASDGKTELGVQRVGVVVATADGVVTTGDVVVVGAVANRLRRLDTSLSGGLSYKELQAIVGRALEDAADGGRFKVALMLG